MSESEEKPIHLNEALRMLAEVHTRDDSEVGYVVEMGAKPFEFQREHYVRCWSVVRKHLGMMTEPEER